MRDFCDGLQICDFQRRIRDRLAEQRPRLVVDGLAEVFRIVAVHQFYRDAQRRQDVVKLRVSAAVEIASGDDVVASLREVDDRVKHRARAAGESEAGHFVSAFEQGHALFQHVGRRVHQAGVDVAQFLQGKQVRRVLGVFEDVAGGAVNRHGT